MAKITTQEAMIVDQDVGEKDPSCTAGRNAKWCCHSGKQYGGSSKKFKLELPYDPAIALLGIYPKNTKTLIQRDTCTPKFIAELFTVAKLWKQPKCPQIDEWIKMMGYIMKYYSAMKKNETSPFAMTQMDLEGIMLSGIKERQKPYDFTCM